MRIISGQARGIRLLAPKSDDVRPTTDRVKESLFGIVGELDGAVVVDLFAGSGALGLEALSRGASAVYCVEKHRRHCTLIQRNAERVKRAMATPGEFAVMTADVLHVPQRLSHVTPDVVFADPPYFPPTGQCPANALLTSPDFGCWAGAARFVLERSRHTPEALPRACMWTIAQQRDYGDTRLFFLQRNRDEL